MDGLTIYKASAGSGKTFRLTGEYLLILFRNPGLYRNILAVTFTNKATGEMKSRILLELNRLARGEKSGYRAMLRERFGYDEKQVQQRAHLIITNILHDYSRFSVSTIDRFFQRVLRTFARELGLQSGYTLETDQSEILNFVIDELLLATEEDPQLRKWLVEFAQSRMKEGKSWRFHDEISNLAGELVKEDVKDLRLGWRDQISDREKLSDYVKMLNREQSRFEQTMKKFGERAVNIIEQNGLGVGHFNNKGKGVARYFYYLRDQRKDKYQPNATVRKVLDDPERWPAGSLSKENKQLVISLASGQLNDLLKQAIAYIEDHYEGYLSINEVLKNIYVLGLLVDIQKRIEAYCRERNIFLISDAGDLLRKIIDDNEAPFIYEKTGSNYHHFMMDEFQDTSRFQWENFRPLVNNSLAQGYFNLVVGDVKQSIYRWRNGDWKILQNEIEQVFGDQTRSEALDSNWRSRRNIVAFNNTLFHYAPAILQNQYDQELKEKDRDNPFRDMLLNAYRDVRQQMPLEREGGRIFTRFFAHAHQQESEAQDRILEKLMEDIQHLQDHNYRPADIAVLVRTHQEGQRIADALTEHARGQDSQSPYCFDFISNDSLFVERAESVKLICSLFRYLVKPDDRINQAFIRDAYLYGVLKHQVASDQWHDIFVHHDHQMERVMPDEFTAHVEELRKMPLYELTERLIRIFRIQELKEEIPYIQAFQEIVLDYSRRFASDLNSFLQWWDVQARKKKLQLPEDYDAIRIITVHKAKGLEFKAVLIPFCNWDLNTHSAGMRKNYLWCHPQGAPLDEAGVVPVEYTSRLADTTFRHAYDSEKFHQYVDNLNVLYVAFTRAEEVLISYVPLKVKKDETPNYQSGDKGLTNVGEMIHFIYENHQNLPNPGDERPFIEDLKEGWDAGERVFSWGTFPDYPSQEESQSLQIHQEHYPVYSAKPSLHLRYEHSGFFSEQRDLFQETIDYGTLMHQVFESIHTRADIEKALDKAYMEGKINRDEKDHLRREIEQKMNHEQTAGWFSGEWKVYTEKEMLLPNGQTYRPDRVMFRDDQTVVVDYKFGAHEDAQYKRQIRRYLKELKRMGYNHPQGYIWYMSQNKLLRVTE